MIVFSDLDGTLLSSKKRLDPRTLAALDVLAERGIEFVPCSGRPLVGLPRELLAHPSVHYAICANGAAVCAVDSGALERGEGPEFLHRQLMDRSAVLRLYEALGPRDVLFDVFADGGVWEERFRYDRMGEFGLDPNFLEELRRMRTPVDVTIPELLPSLRHVERCSVYWKDRADRDLAVSLVEEDPTLAWVTSQPTNVEISDARASKGAALCWLCEHLGMTAADAVAFGDSLNDASMLEAAGDGVAMGNATPDALAVADHVCQDNDAPGVALYLESLM